MTQREGAGGAEEQGGRRGHVTALSLVKGSGVVFQVDLVQQMVPVKNHKVPGTK